MDRRAGERDHIDQRLTSSQIRVGPPPRVGITLPAHTAADGAGHGPGAALSRRRPRVASQALAVAVLSLLVGVALPTVVSAQEVRYSIHAMATSEESKAVEAAAELRRQLGDDAGVRLERHEPYYAVRVGVFGSAAEAQEVLPRVVELGYEDAWIAHVLLAAPEPDRDLPGLVADSDRRDERAAPPAPSTGARSAEVGTFPAAGASPEGPGQGDPVAGAEQAGAAAPPDASGRGAGVAPQGPGPGSGAAGPADQAASGAAAPKQILARRVAAEAPRLDGRLDDPAWAAATFVSGFQQKGARRGFPVRDRTEIAFVYDDDALYVGARMHTADSGAIRAPRSARDDAANADRLIVSLDTYRNRETAYNFGVTAAGTRIDYYQPEDVFEVRDYGFDPVWEARAAVDAGGWTAEMRIPFSSLQFHGAESPVWGVNVQRVSPALQMYAFWIVVPSNEIGWASRFGDLVGLEGVQPARRLAIVPYVAGQTVYSDFASEGNPFASVDGEIDWRYGADVLWDMTPSVAVEATFNPDFGQIEADPAVVNLTAYETFFPERRPFFLEGAQLLQGQGPRYFYSRRVGAAPRAGALRQSLEQATTTTILGAVKLIGRMPNGWSVGTLFAVTDEERARTFDPETGVSGRAPVVPEALFGVSRLQKDLGAGSTFGLVGTTVMRSLPVAGGLADLLPQQAFAGGADFNLRFAGETHEVGGFVGGSLVKGLPAAMLRLQGSSARYFQRPDADHVEIDRALTSLRGYTAGLHLGRVEGPWYWSLSGEARSPGFEINDAGAMATADDIVSFAQVGYGTSVRFFKWQRIDVDASIASGWNFGGIRQFTTPAVSMNVVWRRFWQSYVRIARDTPALSDDLTRGGPLMETPGAWRTRFGVTSNATQRYVWGLDGSYSTDELGGWSYTLATRVRMQLNDYVSVSVMPGYESALDSRQYFDTLDGGGPETFGRRYVFAALDRSTIYTRLRANLAITPNLGFDIYAEPFAASGSYHRFGELAAAGSRELRLFGTDGTAILPQGDGSHLVTDGDDRFVLGNGDFDVWSFRSNFVFRWDYAQGSTLYFVWQQNRVAESDRGQRLSASDLFEGFSAPGEDILALKASFRIGR